MRAFVSVVKWINAPDVIKNALKYMQDDTVPNLIHTQGNGIRMSGFHGFIIHTGMLVMQTKKALCPL